MLSCFKVPKYCLEWGSYHFFLTTFDTFWVNFGPIFGLLRCTHLVNSRVEMQFFDFLGQIFVQKLTNFLIFSGKIWADTTVLAFQKVSWHTKKWTIESFFLSCHFLVCNPIFSFQGKLNVRSKNLPGKIALFL